MIWNKNKSNLTPRKFFLGLPNQHIIGALKGITQAALTIHFNDIWEIDFEVDKYIDGKLNPYFDNLIPLMTIKVEDLGWFRINKPPNEIDDKDGRIYKNFTAYGIECILQDLNLTTFYINSGVDISMEMYEENLNELGIPKQNIKLYLSDVNNDDPTAENYYKLGLLNILERNYLSKKGWKFRNVDPTLAVLRGRKFEINSSNIYAFLTQNIAKAYRCVFAFDRTEKFIDVLRIEDLGKSLNLEFSKRNLINKIDIDYSNTNDGLSTRFRVSGKDTDQTLIEYVNFGSPFLDNLNYYLESDMMAPDTVEKYKTYRKTRESKRQDYTDLIKQRLENLEKISALQELMPVSEVNTIWRTISDEELDMEIKHFEAVLNTIKEMYTANGVFNESILQESPDYSLYISVKEVIIPDLQAEKTKRENGSTVDAERVDYKTNWNLYGLNELELLQKSYQAQSEVLTQGGYDKEWSNFDRFQQGFTLIQNIDYTVSYDNNTNVGTAVVTATGKGSFTGALSSAFRIVNGTKSTMAVSENTNIPPGSLEGCIMDPIPDQQYTGNPITPTIVIKYAGKDRPINQDAWQKQHELYLKYKQYLLDIEARLQILNTRIEELNNANKEIQTKQKELVDSVSLENPSFGFAAPELSLLNELLIESDYVDENIEILETDKIDDIIQHAWDLLESASEQLDIESRPQLTYSIDMDNPYFIEKFADKMDSFEVGDFIFMELDNGFKTKQRAIEVSGIELVNLNDTNFNIKFSDMVTCYGSADDFRFLLDTKSSYSSKNKITKDVETYISSACSSIANQIFNKYLSGGDSGGGIFVNGISQADLQKLQDALDGLVSGVMTLNEFKTKLAQIENLEADSVFVKYLESQFLVGNQAEFKNIEAEVGNFKNLLSGNAGIGDIHNIHLTTKNAVIDNALIRTAVMQSVSVDDLLAGIISTNKFTVKSDDGGITIIGATQQWRDKNNIVRMQAGRDKNGDFTFSLFDTTGEGILIDSTGIKPAAISNGLIVNDMVSDNAAISGSKLDINSVVQEINGGTEKIESSHIWFNEKNQTLNQAFSDVTSSISQTENTLTTIQTGIDGMKVNIGNLETNINGLTDNSIIFNVEYIYNPDDTVTMHGHIYKAGKEVTTEYSPSLFKWYEKTKNEKKLIGSGYSITVNKQKLYIASFDA